MKNKKTSPDNLPQHKIPDLNIIDLDAETISGASDSNSPRGSRSVDEPSGFHGKTPKKAAFSRVNIHVVLLVVAIVFVAGIVYKVKNFGVRIDLDEIFSDGPGEYSENYDTILPLLDSSSNPIFKDYSQGSTILAFGNAPFADDRGSEDNLVSLMQQETGATIYNCSISGSYLATDQNDRDMETSPWDIFTAYWLCNIAAGNQAVRDDYLRALEVLGDDAPPEAREVYDILLSIDLSKVDAVVVMYDASDYIAGHDTFNSEIPTDITTFAGSTEAIIEYLYYYAPDTRVIVMSPTYAFGVDENGEYVSSDIKKYGQDILSTYAILQYAACVSRSVTFVDNIYATIHEDNAKKYLSDNLHLNLKGRKKVAERFAYALNYYNQSGRETAAPSQD